jgi:peptidoglycan/xylan/chitin deacetylase (PgdA/CDA1 family)
MRNTKIRVFLGLILLASAIAGCHTVEKKEQSETVPAVSAVEASKEEYVHEYGFTEAIVDESPNLHVYILYPSLKNAKIDKIISDWANGIYEDAKKELAEAQKTESNAEIEWNIQYNAYYINDRFVSVHERVFHGSSQMAHPEDDVKIFNVDIQNGALISNGEILNKSKESEVVGLLKEKIVKEHPETAEFIGEIDAKALGNISLSRDGVQFTLVRGDYFPNYVSTIEITIDYDSLGDSLILFNKPTSTTTPTSPALPSASPMAGQDEPAKTPVSGDKLIALTFDDGPSQYTNGILDTLTKNGAKATFFVIGNNVGRYSQAVKNVVSQGSEIANHTWDHKQLTKLTADEIRKELSDTNEAVYKAAGVRPTIFRPPYGSVDDSVKGVAKQAGMAAINWSVDTIDWKTKNADAVYNEVIKSAKSGSIILCHDIYPTTAEAMKRVIPDLAAKGYKLVTVSELLGSTEPGRVYSSK